MIDKENEEELIETIKKLQEQQERYEKELKLLRKEMKENNKKLCQIFVGVKYNIYDKLEDFKSRFDDRMYEVMLVVQNELKDMKDIIKNKFE